jgi:molybdate transport system substrate-binding protein
MMRTGFLMLLSALLCYGCGKGDSQKLIIATAANMQYPMKDLINTFAEKTGIECETVISSSGVLTAQIREGAPFDILVSADMKYPRELSREGFTQSQPAIYAYGKLVLWSLQEKIDPSLELLITDRIRHIALPNPTTAPYGTAAVEVLKGVNIYEKVRERLVFGESISQTSQFIVSGAAEIGFTSKSVVLSPEIGNKGKWMEVNEELYTPIAQGIVILKNRNEKIDQAGKFYDFMFSEEARKILDKFGYSVHGL